VDDLVAFFNARLDEREQVAKAASPGPWKPNAEHDEVMAVDDITVADGFALSGRQLRSTVDHIAANDPPSVLADIESKRRIVGRHAECGTGIGYCDDAGRGIEADENNGQRGCAELFDLALPYKDHPDYREEWSSGPDTP
jgi:hypothetical protein